MFSLKSPSRVFGLLAQFGAACAMAFYVFYPEDSKKKESSPSTVSSPRKNESLRLSLCLLAQFLVRTAHSFHADPPDPSHHQRMVLCLLASTSLSFFRSSHRSLHTHFHRLRDRGRFIAASLRSLCFFRFIAGFVSTKQSSDRFIGSMVRYLVCSIVSIFLLLLATHFGSEKWTILASAFIGFFLSVPYALMEMVILRECGRFRGSRMLSVASLNTQLAATMAGYPASRLFDWLRGFEKAPWVEAGMLGVAAMSVASVRWMREKEKSVCCCLLRETVGRGS